MTVELTSASVEELISESINKGIDFCHVRHIDDLCVQARLSGADYLKLNQIILKRGGSIKVIKKHGLQYFILCCLRRPILLVGLAVWLFLLAYLPSRVLFIYVDGNHAVDSARIIEAAESCGIHFGASRKEVRSERVKNALLSEMNELQWAGVNTYGCVAIISVKERNVPEEQVSVPKISSIIAARDGILSSVTVFRGNSICKLGQAVRLGQVLVSGYTDCGLAIKAESAEAEIMAITNRNISAIAFGKGNIRTELNEIKSLYSIQIGKNVVKLFNDSGISGAGCVKIYKERQLALPGGFKLPVSLITETLYSYDAEPLTVTQEDQFQWVKRTAEAYLQSDMISGKVLHRNVSGDLLDGIYRFNGSYICEEMIGQIRVEEIGEYDGEGNG